MSNDARAQQLLERARAWAGRAVVDVAAVGNGKGGVGKSIEGALGLAPKGADVDDPESGVEVKTLPFKINGDGAPRVTASTFVTTASMSSLVHESWSTSRVKKKLSRVLFIPIEEGSQRIGSAFLYLPDDVDEALLRADWEDLSDLVARGLGFAITGRRGQALQLRPKAKNAQATQKATTVDGDHVDVRVQGFYLRPRFTQRLIDNRFGLQPSP